MGLEIPKKGEHRLVESVTEMVKLLDEGWEIDRELNGGVKRGDPNSKYPFE